jgi:hypothetical protein
LNECKKEAAVSAIQRMTIEGLHITREAHLAEMRQIGQLLNHAITRHVEKQMAESIFEAVKHLTDESKMIEFSASIRKACEVASDALRAALAQALCEETDKQEKPSE